MKLSLSLTQFTRKQEVRCPKSPKTNSQIKTKPVKVTFCFQTSINFKLSSVSEPKEEDFTEQRSSTPKQVIFNSL